MTNIFFALTVLAAVAVVISLLLGVLTMARGGAVNEKYGNKLMQARVILQGIAILMFILAVATAKH